MSLVIELPEQIEQLMKLEAERAGVPVEAFAATRLKARYKRVIAEAQEAMNSPRRAYKPEEIYRRYREKYGLEDLSHLSAEEIADSAEKALEALTPEQIAEAERQGLI